ncbi:MAG: substrate-binding domain-containing protein, partial [Butyricicoccus sp.]|nr:substrate-binding domain-containing protein [Butyricicoccus sp.]
SMSASEETRKKVLEAADTLNYAATKSRKGRSLKTALNIGVAISCPYPQRREAYEAQWLSSLEQICKEMKVAWFPMHFEPMELDLAKERKLDGILAIGNFQNAQKSWLFRRCEHVIFMGTSPDESRYDAVEVNHAAGMALAIEYLMTHGHERIGMIGPSLTMYHCMQCMPYEVLQGVYLDAMRMHGLENCSWVLTAPVDSRETKRIFQEYLQSGQPLPTALLMASHENAVGAMAALEEKGITVPEDISILVFSDVVRDVHEANLTSIDPQLEEMCRAAIRLLNERMPGHTIQIVRSVPKKALIPPVLMRRRTVSDSPQAQQRARVGIW